MSWIHWYWWWWCLKNITPAKRQPSALAITFLKQEDFSQQKLAFAIRCNKSGTGIQSKIPNARCPTVQTLMGSWTHFHAPYGLGSTNLILSRACSWLLHVQPYIFFACIVYHLTCSLPVSTWALSQEPIAGVKDLSKYDWKAWSNPECKNYCRKKNVNW